MKKLLFVLSFIIASTSAFAGGKCEGGDPFEGVIDGHEYCISKEGMTWWAAFAWCQHQGRHLASMQEACKGWTGATASCDNLIKSGDPNKWCWTANPFHSTTAHSVDAGGGDIRINGHPRNDIASALCF